MLALLALTASALVLTPGSLGAAQAQRLLQVSGAKRSVAVTVAVGKTEDVRIDGAFTDITIGDSDVADISPLTDRTLSILGKKIGTTRVTLYGPGKMQIGIFDIEVTYDVSRLAAEIGHFSDGSIKVSSVNGRIMLSGTSQDAQTLDRAMIIARQFAPDPINTVTVLQAQQVMLEVRFVEASRLASRALGVQWNSFGKNTLANVGSGLPASQLPITQPRGRFQQGTVTPAGLGGPNELPGQLPISPIVAAGVLGSASPYGFLLGELNRAGLSIDVALNALEEKGLARSLAEPNLVALSGDTASFLAGGEFPVPAPNGQNGIGIIYKTYGVGLAFTPTVLKAGLINLKIEPEVSQLDSSHPVQVAGISVPPLIVRRASTTIELRDGQSFVIGGLLQNDSTTDQDQLPWLGDVPVLGTLFRSSAYIKHETDLAIIVTPHLVRPIAPGTPIKTPLDNTLPANDIDFFLMGKAEITPADARMAVGQTQPYVGHILDLPKDLSKGAVNVVAVKN
ncbi:MAG TPA: type II and III secretion system protein family protein [Xanthobacteraceae bacterium]